MRKSPERLLQVPLRDAVCKRTVALLIGERITAKDTKQRILKAVLDMFAQNGYAGTKKLLLPAPSISALDERMKYKFWGVAHSPAEFIICVVLLKIRE